MLRYSDHRRRRRRYCSGCCHCRCSCFTSCFKKEWEGDCASSKGYSMQIISNAGFGTVSMTHLKIIEILFCLFPFPIAFCIHLRTHTFTNKHKYIHSHEFIYFSFFDSNTSMDSGFSPAECIENRKKKQYRIERERESQQTTHQTFVLFMENGIYHI